MASINIFIGAPIEHASERATLARAVEFLSAQDIPAVVLANVNLGGRQIDLVIGLNQGVLVVESKALSSAVRGSENGDWQVRLTSGRWKDIPNAYVQALDEKLALRDAMVAFAGIDTPYPDSALIFVPAIPAASEIPTGDFKVSVGGLDDLPDRIASVKRRGWSIDRWRTFATHHRFIAVPSIDAALSPKLLDAERLLTAYAEAFARTYGPPASAMIQLSCVCDGETLSSDTVREQAARNGNALLTGESGCGKSLLSYTIALAALGHGDVPIVIPAKDFEGNLRDVVNRQVALLNARSAAAVISAMRLLGRALVLVIDGYNECTPSERQRLTRSIAAAVWRYDATAVISSRIALERNDLLPARTYAVQVPDMRTKRAIAQQAAGRASVDAFSELLGSVGSGLEARMIGQLGQHLPAGMSKYGLFDAYVRERLGTAASDGIRVLSRIARMMTERISFSLSVRELDRLLDREGVSGVLLKALQSANILDTRVDRVSFSHEMFLNIFAAEAIIRRAGDDPDAVVAALRLPQHLEIKPFVLGAIDDDSFRRRVLSNLSDARVIRACLAGQCGPDAQLWANMRCDDVLARIDQEVETVRFELSEEFHWGVQAKPETLQNWTAQDRAVLAAIPHELVAGRRLDDVLSLIGKMDERLDEEHNRLLGEAREKKVALRSGLYAVSYTWCGEPQIALSQISSPLHSGHLYNGPKVAARANLLGRLRSETLSPGQVGLLVELNKYSDRDVHSLGTVLPNILNRLWQRAAHHLRLGLMHAAGMSAHALNEDERRALIAVIEDLMPTNGGFDSTGMIDALKLLGALDDDQAEHIANVKAQISSALAEPNNPVMWHVADGLWNAQFDHPYDGAYCEAWNDLSSDDRKSLLLMAAQGAEGNSMFTPPLIAEVASYADPAVGPILARWTALPPKKEVMSGDAIHGFEIAYAALARLRCPLPDHSAEATSSADHALLACGAIFYWLNREDLSREERRHNCAGSLAVLLLHETGVAAAVVGEFFRPDLMFSESAKFLPGSGPIVTSFGQDFPDEIAAIYRAALERPTRQTGYFEFFRVDDVIEKALANLGRFGNASDIPLLRAWSTHPDHGHSAVHAIKAIEEAPRQA
ncbi:hypothetical protein Sp245p_28005 (plasmid) [Azospirillum baldaniorum]|uniref:nuclease-related domain-containing protein n=1 Tax=Azospirillum baldaniorum TaxID=1064539 RepID=UPI0002DA72FF|nr:nuclease-related domain-containing protein [Azospirillum baldaniorum]AWJ93693.1 hypothetical protein Sp245p_28005 [Azospirillum baldaniorum]TWA67785.1 nuclease-like protein [Azospirillum brasilense]